MRSKVSEKLKLCLIRSTQGQVCVYFWAYLGEELQRFFSDHLYTIDIFQETILDETRGFHQGGKQV